LVSVQYQQLLSKLPEKAKHQNEKISTSKLFKASQATAQQNTRKNCSRQVKLYLFNISNCSAKYQKKPKYQNKANQYQKTEK
jgi:hypothetical protein